MPYTETVAKKEEQDGEADISSHCCLEISSDKMRVDLVLLELPMARELRYEDLMALCNANHVVYGIQHARLKQELKQFNELSSALSSYQIKNIALGQPLTMPQDGRIQMLVKEDTRIHFDKEGRADFRNIDKFKHIKQGAVLARRVPPIEGKAGINVYGEKVPTPEPKDPRLVCGANVAFVDKLNTYIAQEKGIFHRDGNTISISRLLHIDSNVGLETGNIIYDDSVYVEGDVEAGALLSCLGDLEVQGFIESNDVRTTQSLRVHKGINAKDGKMIYIGRDLHTMYLDNSKVYVAKDAYVERSLNATKLIVHGNLLMGKERSVIVGGEIFVYGSLVSNQLGNLSGVPTKIRMGVHDANKNYHAAYLKDVANVKRQYEAVTKEMLRFKKLIAQSKNLHPDIKEEIQAAYAKYKRLELHIQEMRNMDQRYLANIYNPVAITLTVRNELHAGVEISYKTYKKVFRENLRRVVITFDPEAKEPKFTAYTEE